MPRRPKILSQTDRALWHAFARDIRLLPGRAPLEAPPTPPQLAAPPGPAKPEPPPPPARRRHTGTDIVTGLHPAGLDRASWHRFQSGRLVPSRTLDLHGKTAQTAFHALDRFLRTASADQIRCVEIITGRGSGEGGGVIRRELPLWLNLPALRPLVLAAAHPHALNPGSTRLLLRRQRG
jgi:DNA-nicking Smr family endonuclease